MEQTADVKKAIKIVLAVSDAIKELGEIPSGHLYAQLMGHMTLSQYESILGILKQAKVIEVNNHLIKWIGPK